jgi:hypothetical protein
MAISDEERVRRAEAGLYAIGCSYIVLVCLPHAKVAVEAAASLCAYANGNVPWTEVSIKRQELIRLRAKVAVSARALEEFTGGNGALNASLTALEAICALTGPSAKTALEAGVGTARRSIDMAQRATGPLRAAVARADAAVVDAEEGLAPGDAGS